MSILLWNHSSLQHVSQVIGSFLTCVISLSEARQELIKVPVRDSSSETVPFENPVAINVSEGLVVTVLATIPW